ncbi:MAG: peptide transporter ptr2 [Chaenotheca gracillima]|nr:MAG: peptide transporter ptr2 [Chaenotheca gracillima]
MAATGEKCSTSAATSKLETKTNSSQTGLVEVPLEELEATAEELATLRHVGDKVPFRAWLVAIVELSERFTFIGLTGPFRKLRPTNDNILSKISQAAENYMQNPRDDPLRPGALGLGQKTATGLSYFFSFWCYVTPILGAIIADSWLGRYKTICLFTAVYMLGIFILFVTSLPVSLDHGAGLGGLIAAMIVIGLGTGGIKPNVSPLIADQYTGTVPRVRTTKRGEHVIVDPNVTIQTIYNIFYWCINIGALSGIATTWMELDIDFWAAYLLPFCFFWIAVTVLVLGRSHYVTRPPAGSVLPMAIHALWIGVKNKFNMDAAKPSSQMIRHGNVRGNWDDLFIEELKRALIACRVFVAYPIVWVCYGQMSNNLVSQAGTMETHGIPNDVIGNLNPISLIIFIPLVEKLIYPALRRFHIPFKPITRITLGFILVAGAMAYSAGIQDLIYKAGPCYDHPLADECSDGGQIPNHVHVMLQAPVYIITGFAEIFFSITGLEYAYTKAPPSMKSVVMSMFLLTNAFGSALGIALSPTAEDPKLTTTYASLGGVMFVTAVVFFLCFRKYNSAEEKLNRLDAEDTKFAASKAPGQRDQAVE